MRKFLAGVVAAMLLAGLASAQEPMDWGKAFERRKDDYDWSWMANRTSATPEGPVDWSQAFGKKGQAGAGQPAPAPARADSPGASPAAAVAAAVPAGRPEAPALPAREPAPEAEASPAMLPATPPPPAPPAAEPAPGEGGAGVAEPLPQADVAASGAVPVPVPAPSEAAIVAVPAAVQPAPEPRVEALAASPAMPPAVPSPPAPPAVEPAAAAGPESPPVAGQTAAEAHPAAVLPPAAAQSPAPARAAAPPEGGLPAPVLVAAATPPRTDPLFPRKGYSDAQVAHFLAAAMPQPEEGGRARLLSRWQGDIRLRVAGRAGGAAEAAVRSAAAEIAAALAGGPVSLAEAEPANLLVYVLPSGPGDAPGYVQNAYDAAAIAGSRVVVYADRAGREAVMRLLLASLGLPGPVPAGADSVLAPGARAGRLTDLDRSALELLYSPVVAPGMDPPSARQAAGSLR